MGILSQPQCVKAKCLLGILTCDLSVPSPHMANGYCHMLNSWLEIVGFIAAQLLKEDLHWSCGFSFLACYHMSHFMLQLNPKFILFIYRTNIRTTVHCKILKYIWLLYFHDFCNWLTCVSWWQHKYFLNSYIMNLINIHHWRKQFLPSWVA